MFSEFWHISYFFQKTKYILEWLVVFECLKIYLKSMPHFQKTEMWERSIFCWGKHVLLLVVPSFSVNTMYASDLTLLLVSSILQSEAKEGGSNWCNLFINRKREREEWKCFLIWNVSDCSISHVEEGWSFVNYCDFLKGRVYFFIE